MNFATSQNLKSIGDYNDYYTVSLDELHLGNLWMALDLPSQQVSINAGIIGPRRWNIGFGTYDQKGHYIDPHTYRKQRLLGGDFPVLVSLGWNAWDEYIYEEGRYRSLEDIVQGIDQRSTAEVLSVEMPAVEHFLKLGFSNSNEYCIRHFPCLLAVKHPLGYNITLHMPFGLANKLFGVVINDDLTLSIEGRPEKWPADSLRLPYIKAVFAHCKGNYYSDDEFGSEIGEMFYFSLSNFRRIRKLLGVTKDYNLEPVMMALFKQSADQLPVQKLDGVRKAHDHAFPFVKSLCEKEINLSYLMAFRTFIENAQRTIDSVKVSSVFNEMFGSVKEVDDVKKALLPVLNPKIRKPSGYYYGWRWFDEMFKTLPCFVEKRKKALKNNTTRAFNKLMQDFDFLDLDEKKYPRAYKAIMDGDIPVSTFFRKKEQYFLLNDNFALWEEMLKRHYEVTCQLAKEVSSRTTYEKDLMSYFFFLLHTLPEYLKKHTGKAWKCEPKLVNSSTELDPPKEDEVGIVRQRSALTPIVNNESRVVTVPYASLAMPGRQTTYCYSHDYNVLRRGLSFNGNVVINDLEEKLNGKDDYGLMFYTFTGSPQGRGYPTFLIIFERLKSGETRLHFHRTHPCRSKDGDYNPIHNWIRVTYNWMAGNVQRDRIKVQQGDLVFVTADNKDVQYENEVNNYDHHRFAQPVEFARYSKKEKSNILGYIRVVEDNLLSHNEHDDDILPMGEYEIRQCRSWEANPKGIWTFNPD